MTKLPNRSSMIFGRKEVMKGEHSMRNRKKISRSIAVILAVVLTLVVAYFVSFESGHMIHECTGAHCQICQEIHMAESMVKQLGSVLLCAAAAVFLTVSHEKGNTVLFSLIPERTLILDKVRMDA